MKMWLPISQCPRLVAKRLGDFEHDSLPLQRFSP